MEFRSLPGVDLHETTISLNTRRPFPGAVWNIHPREDTLLSQVYSVNAIYMSINVIQCAEMAIEACWGNIRGGLLRNG